MVKIIMILDESGSMNCITHKIRTAVNEFIETQRSVVIEGEEKHDADTFTLVKFSDIVQTPPIISNCPIGELKLLDDSDYKPSGGTALFDAIGLTLTDYKDHDHVLCVIVTDGQENASRTFKTHESIQTLVSTYKQEKSWQFIYLSTDIDTFQQGNMIGISNQSSGCNNIAIGHQHMSSFISKECSRGVTGYREQRGKVSVNLNK